LDKLKLANWRRIGRKEVPREEGNDGKMRKEWKGEIKTPPDADEVPEGMPPFLRKILTDE
jgi:hypothetical protein